MQKFKITAEEFSKVSISKLSTHPNSASAYGEGRMSERELKAAFDKQGELIRKKFNAFLEIIEMMGEGSLADHIRTGIEEDHTLRLMFEDIVSESGRFAEYLSVGDETLLEKLRDIESAFEDVRKSIEDTDKSIEAHKNDRENPHKVTAEQVGLGKVDNTRDVEKPISTPVQEALDKMVERFTADLAEKIGKVGDQSIVGRLSVNELYVAGGAYAKEIEHLAVREAVIVANSDGVPLTELSGYVIRTNGNGAYGILYDPSDDCVKIGHGVFDEVAKVFTYDNGEAQAMATRDAIEHGSIPVWDNDKHCFVDSGASIEMLRGEIGNKIGKSANALIGEKIGNPIVFDDISPFQGAVKVSVESKNLVPTSYKENYNSNVKVIRGVTFTTNDDGSITMNGKFDETGDISFFLVSSRTNPFVLPKGTYVGSTGLDYAGMDCMTIEGKYNGFYPTTYNEETKFQYLYIGMQKYKIAGKTFNGETIYPMLMRGTVCDEFTAPVAVGTEVWLTPSFTDQPIETAVGETIEIDAPNSTYDAINASDDRVSLYVEYNKDINKAFAELQQAIISLGGNV